MVDYTRSNRMRPETVDRIHGLLSDQRRRYLCYLLRESTTWTVDEVSRRLTAWEQDVPMTAIREDDRRRVTVSLVHNHLPRLADDGIEYDADREEIERTATFDGIESFVEHAAAMERNAQPGASDTQARSSGFVD